MSAWNSSLDRETSDKIENLETELIKYMKLAKRMARMLMDLGAGNDVHNEADNCVKKHFPEIYKRYL